MTDFDRIITSAPVNAQAARQMGHGERWKPAVKLQGYFEDQPPMKAFPEDARHNPELIDFRGRKFGRLTVLGLQQKDNSSRMASWVCRCACGGYCTRTAKSLKVADRGGNSFVAMCGRCDYVQRLREGTLRGMRNDRGPK